MKRFSNTRRLLLCAAAIVIVTNCGSPSVVQAQSPQASATQSEKSSTSQSEEMLRTESAAAWEAGEKAGTAGPAVLTLADQAALKLPADYFFIPKAEGGRIMRALGNTVDEPTFFGLIVGTNPGDEWMVIVRFHKEGYIKDDDAKNWNADKLLQDLKDGNTETNKDRVARGFEEWEVVGWMEKPAYDPATHRLVWSVLTKRKGEPDTVEKGVNYNTYALGREGYFSLNLLTLSSQVDTDKSAAHELLAALSYDSGKRYENFNAATDRVAAYGLAALIGGVAAKKLGLIAVIGAFVLKFAKLIGLAAVGVWAGFKGLFRRNPKSAPASA